MKKEKEEKKKKKTKKDKITENFVQIYETDIKKYRDAYLGSIKKSTEEEEEIELDNNNDILFSVSKRTMQQVFVFFFAFAVLYSFDFHIISVIFCIIVTAILSYFIAYLNRNDSSIYVDEYKKKIKKLGYLTLDEFEDDLELYVTGEYGQYAKIFNQLLIDNNIDLDNMEPIYSINGEKTYIWLDDAFVYMLNASFNEKPEIIKEPIGSIVYYRTDYNKKQIVLKSYTKEYYFQEIAVVTLSKLFPGKEYSSKNLLKPELVISDYRTFIYDLKNILETGETTQMYRVKMSDKDFYSIFLGFIIFSLLNYIPNLHIILLNIFRLVALIFLYKIEDALFNLYSVNFISSKKEEDVLNQIKNNKKCQDKFVETKWGLNINSDNCAKIYTIENQEYLIWREGNNLCLFYNEVYYDLIYTSCKVSQIKEYHSDATIFYIKINDKLFAFKIDAAPTITQLITNQPQEPEMTLGN